MLLISLIAPRFLSMPFYDFLLITSCHFELKVNRIRLKSFWKSILLFPFCTIVFRAFALKRYSWAKILFHLDVEYCTSWTERTLTQTLSPHDARCTEHTSWQRIESIFFMLFEQQHDKLFRRFIFTASTGTMRIRNQLQLMPNPKW